MKLFKCDGFTTFKFATLLNWRTIRRGLKTRRRRIIEAAKVMIPTAAKAANGVPTAAKKRRTKR